jgi:hypothetical protein
MSTKTVLKELPIPIHDIDPENNTYGIYIDKPAMFDEYGKQKVLTGIEAAINFIFRSFYGDHRLIPRVQGLFIDVMRWKHVLGSEYNKMRINTAVNEALSAMLKDLTPVINIEFDPITQTMNYNITLNGEINMDVRNADDLNSAIIKINTKKFYE